ncbi:MAG: hypothetical protein IJ309_02045 [Clostridia bacterium]|nr:hypothetical protein [Clostridia bacterium]
MSEFFFDYQCIAGGNAIPLTDSNPTGTCGPTKALAFFLYQDASQSGNMRIQIYIPKALREKFTALKCSFTPDSTEEFKLKTAAQYIPFKSSTVETDGCIYIDSTSSNLSGTGVIGFYTKEQFEKIEKRGSSYDVLEKARDESEPLSEHTYKFAVNYSKKDIIYYRIIEKKSKVTFQVMYPFIREEISLSVVQKVGARPVLIKDTHIPGKTPEERREFKNCFVDSRTNLPAEIILKPTGRTTEVYTVSFPCNNADKNDFRLVFTDPNLSNYYFLSDESDRDNTIEGRRSKIRISDDRSDTINQPLKCPYCGELLAAIPKKEKGKVFDCRGNEIRMQNLSDDLKNKVTVVCGADLVALSDLNAGSKDSGTRAAPVITSNQLLLPDDATKLPSMHVLVAGFPRSGKTIYLSSLFNMEMVAANTISSNCFTLDRILYKFTGEKDSARELKFLQLDTSGSLARVSDEYERSRCSTTGNYKNRYIINVGGNIESRTAGNEAQALAWKPIGYRLGSLGFVYFYDIPGEAVRDKKRGIRSVDVADCYIAVIDGDKDPASALKEVCATLDSLMSMADNKERIKDAPIAIVLTKHDKRLKGNAIEGECFDENSHLVIEDVLSLIDKEKRYKGSELERHIDCSSLELEYYLKTVASDAESAVHGIISQFKNIKFFTCSALGSESCLSKGSNSQAEGKKEILLRPRRLRMELPLIWLMYQRGLIDRR